MRQNLWRFHETLWTSMKSISLNHINQPTSKYLLQHKPIRKWNKNCKKSSRKGKKKTWRQTALNTCGKYTKPAQNKVFIFLFIKEMKYSKTCECCGNVVSAYTHKLNAWNVDMLEKLVVFYNQKHRPAIISELDLSPVEYSVFGKMKHFWIISHVKHKTAVDGEEITWRIPTLKWIEWLQWKRQIENRSASFGKQTLPLNHEARKTDKIWRQLVRVWEIKKDYQRKQGDEYKQEKWSRTLFDFIRWK